jgi:hypothetical protein
MAMHDYHEYMKDDLEDKSTWTWNRKYFEMMSGEPSEHDGAEDGPQEGEYNWCLVGPEGSYWVEPLPAEGMLFLINSMSYEKVF